MILSALPLNSGWRYYPTEEMDVTYSESMLDESAWERLDSLAEWPRHLLREGVVYLRRTLNLQPTEFCVRYRLHLDAAPDGTDVFINGWHVGTTQRDQPFSAEITDQVSLGDNTILLKVSKTGRFGSIFLQPTACD